MTEIEVLYTEMKKHGFELTELQAEQFKQYYDLLVEKNKVMNLTAITQYEDVVKKHFIDSLMISKVVDMAKVKKVCDVGTGAGFPGIPLKILFPKIELILVDSIGKRISFLREVADSLKLENVHTVHARTEDLARDPSFRERFDLVTARAVASMNVLAEYCLPYVELNGVFAAYKSDQIEQEIAESENAIDILGGKIESVNPFRIYDMGRSVVLIRKIKNTPDKYPRKSGIPTKKPLK